MLSRSLLVPCFRLDAPIYENKVRFVCISDTHEKLQDLLPVIPDGDVLIHAGDFTDYGDIGEVIKFNAEIGMFLAKRSSVLQLNSEVPLLATAGSIPCCETRQDGIILLISV